jgi:N-methylhydantoinase B
VPGSGGYGDPKGRDPAKLREDLLDGYVTEEAARDIYGVTNVEGLVKG